MKTLVSICTFGGKPFTELAVRSIYETVNRPVEILIIIGKPGDTETGAWAEEQAKSGGIPTHVLFHRTNVGFAASCNDMIDFARKGGFASLIIMGNDVVVYPKAIDSMIDEAARGEFEWISGAQFDVKNLYDRYPEVRKYFTGDLLVFNDFTARPWEVHKDFRDFIEPGVVRDVQNLCLFGMSAFEKIGFFDVNFAATSYYGDNDFCLRASKLGIRSCTFGAGAFMHFWSRTLHQSGTQTNASKWFELNRGWFETKWGGSVDNERYQMPFNGQPFQLCDGVVIPPTLKIESRENEDKIVRYWQTK